MYRSVELKNRIDGKELEKILIKAAEDTGLRAVSIDEFDTEYNLDTLREEKIYYKTKIRLLRKFLPLAEIGGIKKGEKRGWFSIMNGFYVQPFGFGSKKKIDEYLRAVSKYIR